MATALVEVISAAMAAHDPLDPWLVQSNYDEHYWDDIATEVAPRVASASSESEVFGVLVEALSHLVTVSDDDPYARDRLAAAARVIWSQR